MPCRIVDIGPPQDRMRKGLLEEGCVHLGHPDSVGKGKLSRAKCMRDASGFQEPSDGLGEHLGMRRPDRPKSAD